MYCDRIGVAEGGKGVSGTTARESRSGKMGYKTNIKKKTAFNKFEIIE
jgi:hypothetical protein